MAATRAACRPQAKVLPFFIDADDNAEFPAAARRRRDAWSTCPTAICNTR